MRLRTGPVLLTQTLLLLLLLLHTINAQDCAGKFLNGREDFVVDLQASVERGAELIASPQVTNAEDCVEACCLLPQCTVVLVDGRTPGSSTCSLFNCLYKKGFACRLGMERRASVQSQRIDASQAHAASPLLV